jgi:hypothetical protein
LNKIRPTLHDAEDFDYICDATPIHESVSAGAADGVFVLNDRRVLVLKDVDPIGPVSGSEDLPAHEETGWTKTTAWFGDQTHDDARSLGYSTSYEKNGQRIELVFYVWGSAGDYGVECQQTVGQVDPETDTMECDEISYETDPRGFSTYEAALRAARGLAVEDERWKLGR